MNTFTVDVVDYFTRSTLSLMNVRDVWTQAVVAFAVVYKRVVTTVVANARLHDNCVHYHNCMHQ